MGDRALETLSPDKGLTLHNVEAFRNEALACLQRGDLMLDLNALGESDSSALACLFELIRVSSRLNRQLDICGMPTSLVRLAEVYGVVDLLPIARQQG